MKILFCIIMVGLGFVLGLLVNVIAKYIVDTKSNPHTKEFDLTASMLISAWIIIVISLMPSISIANIYFNRINELEKRINTIEKNTQYNSVDTLVITDIKIPE